MATVAVLASGSNWQRDASSVHATVSAVRSCKVRVGSREKAIGERSWLRLCQNGNSRRLRDDKHIDWAQKAIAEAIVALLVTLCQNGNGDGAPVGQIRETQSCAGRMPPGLRRCGIERKVRKYRAKKAIAEAIVALLAEACQNGNGDFQWVKSTNASCAGRNFSDCRIAPATRGGPRARKSHRRGDRGSSSYLVPKWQR